MNRRRNPIKRIRYILPNSQYEMEISQNIQLPNMMPETRTQNLKNEDNGGTGNQIEELETQ